MSYLFPTYARWEVEVSHAEGSYLYDTNGKKYLDFVSGIAVCNLGHRPKKVLEAIEEQLQNVWHVSNLFQQPIQEELAEILVRHSSGDAVFFANSGAEANEAAIKLAKKYTGKHKIITFQKSFHGRTFLTMTATGQEKVQEGYGPLAPTFEYLPYNDVEKVKQLQDDSVAAIMLEVVQGEGGVVPGKKEFLQAVEQKCKELNALLIIDEVQTGIGRTGKPFAYQHFDLDPDIITVAKGLGSGIPVGAMIGKEKLKAAFSPGSHGSTFGGNYIAMAAALATVKEIFHPAFLTEVKDKSTYFQQLLEKTLNNTSGFELRGLGLMVGIDCHQNVNDLISTLREKGLLVLPAGPNVIRLLPPLTVTKEEIDQAVAMIQETLLKVSEPSLQ
ncbi:acetylornithine transaminase [Bacillus kexueae]|uniref:acetylornithine transaminase n=1 Tax=Aeribacillus kexueae TaxID=2078952 RepID=UPI001FAF5AB8|nr:acetylornithine transaminase [Bacillus kexueae]